MIFLNNIRPYELNQIRIATIGGLSWIMERLQKKYSIAERPVKTQGRNFVQSMEF